MDQAALASDPNAKGSLRLLVHPLCSETEFEEITPVKSASV
jgi:hypothetical protein